MFFFVQLLTAENVSKHSWSTSLEEFKYVILFSLKNYRGVHTIILLYYALYISLVYGFKAF